LTLFSDSGILQIDYGTKKKKGACCNVCLIQKNQFDGGCFGAGGAGARFVADIGCEG
jgi:hypothetical protein